MLPHVNSNGSYEFRIKGDNNKEFIFAITLLKFVFDHPYLYIWMQVQSKESPSSKGSSLKMQLNWVLSAYIC